MTMISVAVLPRSARNQLFNADKPVTLIVKSEVEPVQCTGVPQCTPQHWLEQSLE